MSPTVTAAIIAASVSFLTLVGTLVAQVVGRRATSKQLERTFAEQRTRTLNERFATAAGQLGDDKRPAVRLAGVYTMAGLVDDWPENRQTCVDVLCAYLRLPYEPDPGDEAAAPERLAFRASREVRHTVIRVITVHLQAGTPEPRSWQGLNFDFTGVVFDGGDFGGAVFSGGTVDFSSAQFSGGEVSFFKAEFSGGKVSFFKAEFSGGTVLFGGAGFSGDAVTFSHAKFSRSEVLFNGARFSGAADFVDAEFSGGTVSFFYAKFSGSVSFLGAKFSGGKVDFRGSGFSHGTVDFGLAGFSGGAVDFRGAFFSGGTVSFADPRAWAVPPAFPWKDSPPPGVTLPRREDQSQA